MFFTTEDLRLNEYLTALKTVLSTYPEITSGNANAVAFSAANLDMYLGSNLLPAPRVSVSHSYGLILIKASGYYNNFKVSSEACGSYSKETCSQQFKIALTKVLTSYYTKILAYMNALLLTKHVKYVLTQADIPVSVEFSMGDNLIFGLTDTHLGINLEYSVLLRLDSLIGSKSQYPMHLIDAEIEKTFSALPCILEAVRRRTIFSVELGFYSWKSAKNLLRKSYHTKYTNCHNGVGYYTSGDVCALLEVRSCTGSEVQQMLKEFPKLFKCENTAPRASDYKIAHSEQELEKLKTWFKTKYPNDTYKIQARSDGTYLFIYKTYLACAYIFGPINTKTYAIGGDISLSRFLGGDLSV